MPSKRVWRDRLRGQGERLRFLLAGAGTTLFSYAIYLGLLWWWRPMPAYVVAYVAGIVFAYALNSRWVFRGRWTWSGLLLYPLVYVVQAAISFVLFALLIGRLGVPAALAPLLVVIIALPATYFLGKRIVYHTSRPTPGPGDSRP